MTDRELYQYVHDAQEEGFRALFGQYQAYVYQIVWGKIRNVGTAEDAEDCVSEVFLQVFLHFEEIRGDSLRAYIGTVAKHKAIDYARKLGKTGAYITGDGELPENLASDEDVAGSIEDAVESRELLAHIRSLGEPDTSILILRYFYDKKSSDIARHLHMTPVAVRVRLNRALGKLRRLLSREDQAGR